MSVKTEKRIRRHKKIRARIHGTEKCPRLFVFRSLNHIYAQLINDDKAEIIDFASDRSIKGKHKKIELAKEVGKLIAKKAAEKKIEKVIFDRGGNIFHGRIKAVAEGAREGGLKF
jgi:large subunit ribosomal protein L18